MIIAEDDYLEHYGQKGMKWGVRKQVSFSERREGRKAIRDVAKSARGAMRDARRANSPAERKAAADRYEDEVLKRVRTKEFRTKFENANTMGKGEMATHILFLGPLAALTIPSMKRQYAQNQTLGPDVNRAAAQKILKELRNL